MRTSAPTMQAVKAEKCQIEERASRAEATTIRVVPSPFIMSPEAVKVCVTKNLTTGRTEDGINLLHEALLPLGPQMSRAVSEDSYSLALSPEGTPVTLEL